MGRIVVDGDEVTVEWEISDGYDIDALKGAAIFTLESDAQEEVTARRTDWEVDLDDLTVIVHHPMPYPYRPGHSLGSSDDMNPWGDGIETLNDLRDFIRELHTQGYYSERVRDQLLAAAE